MQESFLHFVWQFSQFNRQDLRTTNGELVQIIRSGTLNANAGPDFSQARIQIGTVEWAGNVEIHLCSSDWLLHGHQHDAAYDNVILHVVWEADQVIHRPDGSVIPTLALQNRVDQRLLYQYQQLLENREVIPCAAQFGSVDEIYKRQALDNALLQRLRKKAAFVLEMLRANGQDWEETTYQLLARNFGFSLNGEPFGQLARAVPLKLLHKHRDNLLQMEALLFGQANFLEGAADEYSAALQREYTFLSKKYALPAPFSRAVWKFSRLRPANFPTVRIAHLAALLQHQQHLFSRFIGLATVEEVAQLLRLTPSAYWQTHYTFGKRTKSVAALGKSSRENIVLNTVAPLLAAYAQAKDDYQFIEKAVALLENIPAEDNRITRIWQGLQLPIRTAFDSQASIEWYTHGCLEKKCLQCPVGTAILKKI